MYKNHSYKEKKRKGSLALEIKQMHYIKHLRNLHFNYIEHFNFDIKTRRNILTLFLKISHLKKEKCKIKILHYIIIEFINLL